MGGDRPTVEGRDQPFHSSNLETGSFLQRLFSTFPDGLPGVGLVLLRVAAALSLIRFDAGDLTNLDSVIVLAWHLARLAGAILLLAGLWTPVAGALVAVAEACSGFAAQVTHPDGQFVHLLLVVLAA